MIQRTRTLVLIFVVLASGAVAQDSPDPGRHDSEIARSSTASSVPSDDMISAISNPRLKTLVHDVLARNPRLAREQALAQAAEQRAPQVSALPDPMVGLSLFLLPPQTRVGPQQAAISLSQRFPWSGKLSLREKAAVLDAASAVAIVEARRLELITETRRLFFELSFLEEQERIVRDDRSTLQHYEQLAQARYSSGVGLGQSVIKIQAEITRSDTRLLEIGERRAALVAAVNSLRDLPSRTPVSVGPIPEARPLKASIESLRSAAFGRRPELFGVEARIESASTRIELAKKDYKPDFTVGLNYGLVGRRDDSAGEAFPPEGNGDDILSVSGAINLPIWKKKLDAGVEEHVQRQLASEDEKRALLAEIEGGIGDHASRIPLLYDQLRLYDNVLLVQAEQSLLSAEAAYASGTLSSLDLLDAERVLLNVRIAAARSRTDHAIAVARLEGEIADSLENLSKEEQ